MGADAVRAAEQRAAALLPALHAAPGAARHPGARAAGRRRRADPAPAVRPAGGAGQPAARAGMCWRPSRRTSSRWARCWRACTWPAPTSALRQPHLRGLAWWIATVPEVLPFLDDERARLLRDELAFQRSVAASSAAAALPRGAIHADLFRDNVVFDDGGRRGPAQRAVRLLLRRHRRTSVRPGGVPERLVHRPAQRPAARRPRRGLLRRLPARARASAAASCG